VNLAQGRVGELIIFVDGEMKDVGVLHQGHEVFECCSAVYYGPVLFDLSKVLGQEYASLRVSFIVPWVK